MTLNLARKKCFVEKISAAVTPVQPNVESIQYRIFQNKESTVTREYLVINYEGGARTVRNCEGNSCSAILEEIAKYLRSGYYAEERDLQAIENDSETWKEVI